MLTGAIGIGLGFGLQAIAANFVSGFVLLMDKSIKPGDVISFTGTTGTSTEGFGWVQELRGRYVVVRDRDGVETLVPNQHLITNPVINWSYTDPRVRLKLPVRVSYQDDPELALEVLLQAADDQPRMLRDPTPVSRLMDFNDSGFDLELRFWIADPQEGVNNVRSDVNRAIWRAVQGERHHHPGGPARCAHGDAARRRAVSFMVDPRTWRSASSAPPARADRTSTRSPLQLSCASASRAIAAWMRRRSSGCASWPAVASTDTDDILIVARNHRTQEGNRRDAWSGWR